jgi:ubiquinone/menaquinone biosynthesis C-methylase UbiE
MADPSERYQTLLERVCCNQCGGDSFDVVYGPRYDAARPEEIENAFRSSGDEILVDQLVRCHECGLQYLNPRLRSNVILQAYSSGSDEAYVSQLSARERTFRSCLKTIERYVPRRGRILDVGTGAGSFLQVAKEDGWEVAGCELNRWLAEWGSSHYGLSIHPGTIFDMKLEEGSFDVVTLWDVLEHTCDPKAVLRECRRVLKTQGRLAVNYPDIGSSVARLMGHKWVFLLSVHLYYFTPESLGSVLKSLGFEVVVQRRHWQYLGLGYIFHRMKPYLPMVSGAGVAMVNGLKLQAVQIPYWMGQRLALARRVG